MHIIKSYYKTYNMEEWSFCQKGKISLTSFPKRVFFIEFSFRVELDHLYYGTLHQRETTYNVLLHVSTLFIKLVVYFLQDDH
jgi:hypothetical protein